MSLPKGEPRLDVTREQDRSIVHFVNCDSLNEYNADRIGQLLANLAIEKADHHYVLDLAGIEYMTSTVLGHIMGLSKMLRTGGGRLALQNVGPTVQDVLRLTQLDQVLEVHQSPPAG